MSLVLAFVTKKEAADAVIRWAAQFAAARKLKLGVVCWLYSPTHDFPLLVDDEQNEAAQSLEEEARRVLAEMAMEEPSPLHVPADQVMVRCVMHPSATDAAMQPAFNEQTEYLVAMADDPTGKTGAGYSTSPLLRQSPCHTVILYHQPGRSVRCESSLVFTTDNIHDRVAADLAARMALLNDSTTTVATVEEEAEKESHEVGVRVIRQLLKDAGVEMGSNIVPAVYLGHQIERDLAQQADRHDIVFVAANQQSEVHKLMELTARPTIAVVKRAPPLREWSALGVLRDWIPQLNPGDYADLIQSLRRGSSFNTDFRLMLGLAAVIATLGLLQNSPAIVIGSMLLAPLMTPMVGAGLSLAQANATLAKSSLKAISLGFLMTLMISYTVAWVTPGKDLTAQVIARSDPNLLDLLVALASAMAAAYAMARPSIVGAIAGVAIATALVPPLCSCGIALAYRQGFLAMGTSMLFITNLVAIIIGAAAVFRFMGVTSARVDKQKQRWVYKVFVALALIALMLAVPLEFALERQIEMGKPHPIAYLVPRSVGLAVMKRVDQEPDVEVILIGRPSIIDSQIDVAIYLASRRLLPRTFADELVEIVRHEMKNDDLRVIVSCLQESWLESESTRATSVPTTAGDP